MMRSVEDLMKQPVVQYARTPYGPITSQRHDDHCTAVAAAGSVVIGATSWAGPHSVVDALQAGVPVTVDGQQVAVIRQVRSAATSLREPILLESNGQLPIPAGTRVIKKGMQGIPRMVADQGVLISHPFPAWLTQGYRLKVADGVDPRLVVIYAAITFGLKEALGI